jgi:hypothetical protein
MKARFLERGGVILEDTAFRSAEVCHDGVALRCASGAVPHPPQLSQQRGLRRHCRTNCGAHRAVSVP